MDLRRCSSLTALEPPPASLYGEAAVAAALIARFPGAVLSSPLCNLRRHTHPPVHQSHASAARPLPPSRFTGCDLGWAVFLFVKCVLKDVAYRVPIEFPF